eukprot:Skav234743  [mRNA]  locus=scaffold14:447879:448490:- [translate_table: standard]
MRHKTRQFWRCFLADGCFLGLLAAPPCETWSVARWLSAHRQDKGPPPVRDALNPRCLRDASLRHLRQVDTSNDLQISFVFAAIATVRGTAWVFEHPAEPSLDCAATMWQLPEVQDGSATRQASPPAARSAALLPTHILAFALDSMDFMLLQLRPTAKLQLLHSCSGDNVVLQLRPGRSSLAVTVPVLSEVLVPNNILLDSTQL